MIGDFSTLRVHQSIRLEVVLLMFDRVFVSTSACFRRCEGKTVVELSADGEKSSGKGNSTIKRLS
uniref:Protein binding protein n=1 Tax=Rhizophora mucronata TaxID=61149 RepID=A0A2P2K251_RHIMU